MTWESRTGVPEGRLEGERYWPILESPQHLPPRRPASAPEMGNSGDPAHLRILEDRNDLKVEVVSGVTVRVWKHRDYAMQCKARHKACSPRTVVGLTRQHHRTRCTSSRRRHCCGRHWRLGNGRDPVTCVSSDQRIIA